LDPKIQIKFELRNVIERVFNYILLRTIKPHSHYTRPCASTCVKKPRPWHAAGGPPTQ